MSRRNNRHDHPMVRRMSFSRLSLTLLSAILGLAGFSAAPASAAPDRAAVAVIFHEAKAISDRDGGRLWGLRLYGPMLIVDPIDRGVVANAPDADGLLKSAGAVFIGALPESVMVSNTPIEWAGTRWTELTWPLVTKGYKVYPIGDDWRRVLLAHEMFHRIQPTLRLTRPEIANVQLDTLQGRYLLQLEWRALARALTATTPAVRRATVADALLFRNARYRLFPEAAADEMALEFDEGLAEYTGVRLGLTTPEARTRYAVYDLSAFLGAPTFVRSFAYADGPAYGLLLDAADPAWRHKLGSGRRLDQLLASAMGLPRPDFAALKAREAAYDPGASLHADEVARDQRRQAMLAALTARLVEGPVLRLPLRHANYAFNPQTLQPLGDYGTVYPAVRLSDDWGVLEVEHGGALFDKAMKLATVSAAGADPATLAGDGWRLTLNKGWALQPGPRKGDLLATRTAGATP
jgi:hypothetical protein